MSIYDKYVSICLGRSGDRCVRCGERSYSKKMTDGVLIFPLDYDFPCVVNLDNWPFDTAKFGALVIARSTFGFDGDAVGLEHIPDFVGGPIAHSAATPA